LAFGPGTVLSGTLKIISAMLNVFSEERRNALPYANIEGNGVESRYNTGVNSRNRAWAGPLAIRAANA
jgi:hypothetical protein